MKAVTKELLVYSNEIVVKDYAALQTFLESLHDEIDNLTECQHNTLFYEDAPDNILEPTVDTYFYMLDGYCIGSSVIVYTSNQQPNHNPSNEGTIEVYFTILITDDPNDKDAQYYAHDNFNPIFLNAESPCSN